MARAIAGHPSGRRAQPRHRVEIRIAGCLEPQWSEWFEGLEVSPVGGDQTVLSGSVPDQAALYGLIAKLRDLGVQLLSIRFDDRPS